MIKLLIKLYGINIYGFRKLIIKILLHFDKNNGHTGECWSIGLREIYRKYHNVDVGIGSYGCFDVSRFPSGTIVGNYCSIAAGVRYFNANHPLDQFTTHPMIFNSSIYQGGGSPLIRNSLTIGNDVWIGFGVLITPNVKRIGNGVIIGAGSVVTHDIPDWAICVGNPCKIIKYRNKKDDTWYEWDVDHIIEEYKKGNL